MDVSDARRLKALEENGRRKRRLADALLDNIVLKDLPGSKPWDAIDGVDGPINGIALCHGGPVKART